MRIGEIDAAIATCREHLDASGAWGSEIELFLTRYVLIRIRANFEQQIQSLLSQPLQVVTDGYVRALAVEGMARISQGSKTSDISNMLKRIDPTLRDRFRIAIGNTPSEQSFNQLVASRNAVAHGLGADLTFRDMVDHYERAHIILDALRDSIRDWRDG